MKILIVGNYRPSNNQSMMRFTDILVSGLEDRGIHVEVVRPSPFLGRLFAADSGVGKVAGAFDRFILFPCSLLFSKFDGDVLHIPDHGNAIYLMWFREVPVVVTCHDVQPYRSAREEIRENSLGMFSKIYQHWVFSWIKRAEYLACVSETTRNEFLQLAGNTSTANTRVIDPGLTYPYSPMLEEEARHRLRRLLGDDQSPFVIHVGSNVWYKNRLGVAKIFSGLIGYEAFRGMRLVTAGRRLTRDVRTWLVEQGHGERLKELGPVEDEDLRALYSKASFLLFPSFVEGFGMPIIEAQACGCLVVTSDRSPMRDVAGSGSILIDPLHPLDAARTINDQWKERDTMRAKGMANAKRYSVDAMISGYIELYNQAMGREPTRRK